MNTRPPRDVKNVGQTVGVAAETLRADTGAAARDTSDTLRFISASDQAYRTDSIIVCQGAKSITVTLPVPENLPVGYILTVVRDGPPSVIAVSSDAKTSFPVSGQSVTVQWSGAKWYGIASYP